MTASEIHPTVETVLDAERRRGRALVARDLATLREVLSPDLTHTHTRGVTDNLASFLHFVEHDIIYLSASREDVEVRLFGDIAVMTGKSTNHVQLNGRDPICSRAQVLQVWQRQDGRWSQIAFQSTTLPASETDPFSSYRPPPRLDTHGETI
jgi:Domain of unknown function (DUF4440)